MEKKTPTKTKKNKKQNKTKQKVKKILHLMGHAKVIVQIERIYVGDLSQG